MPSVRRTVLGGTLALTSSAALGRLISFGSFLLIARSMSLAEYGVLTLAMTVGGPLSFFSGLGLEPVVVAECARAIGEGRLAEARKLFRSFAQQKILATIVLIALGAVLREPLSQWFGPGIAAYFFWISLWAGAVALGSTVGLLLQMHARFAHVSLLDTSEGVIRLACITALAFFGTINPVNIIIVSIAARLLSVIPVSPQLRTLLRLWRTHQPSGMDFWTLVRTHGKWATLSHGVVVQIDNTVRPWMINFFFGTEAVALITVPSSIFGALSILFPVHKVMAPLIAAHIHDPARAAHMAQKATKVGVWSATAIAIVAAILILPFIQTFFPQYEASIPLFWILLPRLPLLALGANLEPFFNALRAQRDLLRYQLVGVASDISLLPLCLTVFGIPGIFVERWLAMAATTTLRARYLRRVHGVTILPLNDLFRFTAEDRALVRQVWLSFRNRLPFSKPV